MPIPKTPLNLKEKTSDETWENMLTAQVLWLENHGDFAGQGAHDEHGRKLYRWLLEQRLADSKGELSVENVNALNTLLMGWQGNARFTSDSRRAKVDAIIEWYNQNGRLPRNQKGTSEEELTLNKHLVRLQLIAKGKRGDNLTQEYAELIKELDAVMPEWRSKDSHFSSARSWDAAAAEFVQWVNGHNRLPAWNAEDREEKAQFRWLAQMRTASQGNGTRRWSTEYGDFLDEFVPAWRGSKA
jgi:hypothetical protein